MRLLTVSDLLFALAPKQAPEKVGELLHLDTFCDREIIAVALGEKNLQCGAWSVDKLCRAVLFAS